jgi:hypothetical protein
VGRWGRGVAWMLVPGGEKGHSGRAGSRGVGRLTPGGQAYAGWAGSRGVGRLTGGGQAHAGWAGSRGLGRLTGGKIFLCKL